jgi:hypothetical protein
MGMDKETFSGDEPDHTEELNYSKQPVNLILFQNPTAMHNNGTCNRPNYAWRSKPLSTHTFLIQCM